MLRESRIVERDVAVGVEQFARLGLVDPRQRRDIVTVLAAEHGVGEHLCGAEQFEPQGAHGHPGSSQEFEVLGDPAVEHEALVGVIALHEA